MKRFTILAIAVVMVVATAAPAFAAKGGNTPIAPDVIYADGELYGTIFRGALPYNNNPQAFDQLFLIDGQDNPVAEAAPGKGYNGGRWLPTPVSKTASFPMGEVIKSYEELHAAEQAGWVVIGDANTDAAFLCPLIPNH